MVQVQLPLPFSLGPLVKRSRHRPFTAVTGVRFPHGSPLGSLAQLGEHLPYKQRVSGSSPLTSTTKTTHESEWFFFLSLETTGVPGDTRRAALRSVWAAAFFQHRLSGVRELPQACSPLSGRQSFLAPAERGGANCVSVFAPDGRGFFAEIQRGVALCGARGFAAPRGGARG